MRGRWILSVSMSCLLPGIYAAAQSAGSLEQLSVDQLPDSCPAPNLPVARVDAVPVERLEFAIVGRTPVRSEFDRNVYGQVRWES